MADNKELTSEQQIAALKAQLAEQKQLNAEQGKVIEEQHNQLNEIASSDAPAVPVLTIDKKKYQVVIRAFEYKGVKHTVKSLSEDKNLQKELVKISSGVLKEIE
ncbi:hypothetical protein [uncultured Pontibacter sp.]|uniref:hypothetical protein n=1 Tax=uncultured Pontibacter sp. TaxID=453356 RepID=UPI002605F2A6|nr:hypothetical protein [uncultured Pontibacter sp.]